MSKVVTETQGYRGTNEGSKISEVDSLWDEGALKNDLEFGTSGFTILNAGGRHSDGGNFGGTETSTTNALRWRLKYDILQLSLHYD